MNAMTGEIHYSERIGGEFSASPLAAGDRIYFFDQEGKTTLLALGKEFKVIGKNSLGDGFMASPAAVDGALFLRSKSKLYRVESSRVTGG